MGIATASLRQTEPVSILVTENGRRLPLTFRFEDGEIAPDPSSLTHWFLRAWCFGGQAACDHLLDILRSGPRPGAGTRIVEAGGVELEVNPFLCRLRFLGGDQASDWVEVPTLDLLNVLRQVRPRLRGAFQAA